MYTSTWKKYLPVIRLLLKRSAAAEQVVTLNRIDFEKNSKTRKPACSFAMEIVNARLKVLNQSAPAKDLFTTLLEDETAKSLLLQHHYTISLNSNFQLSIKNSTPLALPEGDADPKTDMDNTEG